MCDISVIIATYNRCDLLAQTLESLLVQEGDASYEVIVIDNNSDDRTKGLVEELIQSGQQLQYDVEPRQGVSYARNKGIVRARAPIVAFLDDDVRPASNWVQTIKNAFDANPDVACIGGPVLPRWQAEPPRWLTRVHWAPLALQDYGHEPFTIDRENRRCLVSANLAVRREAFEQTGLFAPELQRVKDGIGSMEDLELLDRFWRRGFRMMYQPALCVTACVPLDRMSFRYHRRWHFGHGAFYAQFRSDEMERSGFGHFLGVPAHLFRKAFADAIKWCGYMLGAQRSTAFRFETALCFFAGFMRKRAAESIAARGVGGSAKIMATRSSPDAPRKPHL